MDEAAAGQGGSSTAADLVLSSCPASQVAGRTAAGSLLGRDEPMELSSGAEMESSAEEGEEKDSMDDAEEDESQLVLPARNPDVLAEEKAKAVGAERMVFGSNAPWAAPVFGVEAIRRLRLGDAQEHLIFRGNFQRIYRLE